MPMKVFANCGIQNGIENYLKFHSGEDINKIHIFEFCVVKVLVNIYGEINIINPYKLGKEDSFKKNLMNYELSESEMEMFIKYMGDYDKWLNNKEGSLKTSLPNQICSIIINMILLKSNNVKIGALEIKQYDDFFNPTQEDLIKLQNLILEDPLYITSTWLRKKSQLEKNIVLEQISPNLYPPEVYANYGIDIEAIKKLSNLDIQKINHEIKIEEEKNAEGGKAKSESKKLILTSGSGFVDTMVLLSIMATEIMVGLLIAFSFLRR